MIGNGDTALLTRTSDDVALTIASAGCRSRTTAATRTVSAGYARGHEGSYAQLRITVSMFSVRLCGAGSDGNAFHLLRALSVH